jgi:hypothetical protein
MELGREPRRSQLWIVLWHMMLPTNGPVQWHVNSLPQVTAGPIRQARFARFFFPGHEVCAPCLGFLLCVNPLASLAP